MLHRVEKEKASSSIEKGSCGKGLRPSEGKPEIRLKEKKLLRGRETNLRHHRFPRRQEKGSQLRERRRKPYRREKRTRKREKTPKKGTREAARQSKYEKKLPRLLDHPKLKKGAAIGYDFKNWGGGGGENVFLLAEKGGTLREKKCETNRKGGNAVQVPVRKKKKTPL